MISLKEILRKFQKVMSTMSWKRKHGLSDRGGVGVVIPPKHFELGKIQLKLGHWEKGAEYYIMLIHQLKKRVVKRNVYRTCITNLKIAPSSLLRTFIVKNYLSPTMVGLKVDAGLERMSNMHSVNYAKKISKLALLCKTAFETTNLKR